MDFGKERVISRFWQQAWVRINFLGKEMMMGYKGMGKVGKVNWYHRLE
jgi:hypothetical protein